MHEMREILGGGEMKLFFMTWTESFIRFFFFSDDIRHIK